jgi:uncharacterized coiled-coil protein SlyX
MNEIDDRRILEDIQYRLDQIEARLVFIENKIDELSNRLLTITH